MAAWLSYGVLFGVTTLKPRAWASFCKVNLLHLRFLLVLLLSGAVVLAGCATPADDNADDGTPTPGTSDGTPDDPGTPPTDYSAAQAASVLSGAAASFPARFGIEMTLFHEDVEALSFDLSADEDTGESYLIMTGDPTVFAGEGGSGVDLNFDFDEGMLIYTTTAGTVWQASGVAYVLPPDDGNSATSGMNPAAFLEDGPDELFGSFGDTEGVEVVSVTPMTYRGKAAVETLVRFTNETGSGEATIIIFTASERIAHMEATLTNLGTESAASLEGARFVADFFYEGEVTIAPAESILRANGLRYDSDAEPFGNNREANWTFLVDSGIALGELELHVKDASAATDMAAANDTLVMALTSAAAEDAQVRLTFTDVDGDGTLSAGDTVHIVYLDENSATPTVVLYDTVTGTHVVPAVGVWALLGMLGVIAVALRRR